MRENLISRPANIIHEYLSPTPSDLFEAALVGYVDVAARSGRDKPIDADRESWTSLRLMPQGFHLIYFPQNTTRSGLMSDGCDNLHFPGEPWSRRMWAGGSIEFASDKRLLLTRSLAGKRLVCRESVADVKTKGLPGKEKIFVRIDRLYGSTELANVADKQFAAITERRDLVFMKEKTREEVKQDLARRDRVLKPTIQPDFSIIITPDAHLLFRFSALTYNAHRIHLDRQYARDVEGYRDLLVHGPLSLCLMLKVLHSRISTGRMIKKFDYRNLAPLYCDEEMRICVRRAPSQVRGTSAHVDEASQVSSAHDGFEKWDVWIEGRDGGYAVKATAEVGYFDADIMASHGTRPTETEECDDMQQHLWKNPGKLTMEEVNRLGNAATVDVTGSEDAATDEANESAKRFGGPKL